LTAHSLSDKMTSRN